MTLLRNTVLIAVLVTQVACGTLLYPERRNQRSTGQVDYGVVLMDAVWLLVFIVPGVAALVIDFATGAIYLPSGGQQFFEKRAGVDDPTLVLRPAGHVVVRAPHVATVPTIWRFELRPAGDPATLATWTWDARHDLHMNVPAHLSPGAYALRVLRNDLAVGDVSVRIAPASGTAG